MKATRTLCILCLCLSVLAVILAACDGGDKPTDTAPDTAGETTAEPTDTSAATDTPTEGDTAMSEPETTAAPVDETELAALEAMLSPDYAGRELPIGGWSTPTSALRDGYTGETGSYDKAFRLLADAGLNFMITLEEWSSGSWPQESLSSAKKAGMKLWYNCAGMEPAYSMEKIHALLASPDADALAVIYAKDEPSFDGIGETAAAMAAIREGLGADSKLPVMANLLPTYANSAWIGGDYRNYVRTYIESAKPDFLMFDFYPFQGGNDQLHVMMANIAIAREEADRAGIELYTFLQSSGQPTMQEPTIPELRVNAHINLAMGVKGFAYFLVCEHYEGWEFTNMLTAKGETTELYEKVKTVNAELEGMKGAFLDYTNKGILVYNYTGIDKFFTRQGCEGTLLDSFGSIVSIEGTKRDKAVIGCFEGADGREAYYVVNAAYEKESTITLKLSEAQSYVIWSRDGARRVDNTDTLELALDKGEGVFVIKYDVHPHA